MYRVYNTFEKVFVLYCRSVSAKKCATNTISIGHLCSYMKQLSNGSSIDVMPIRTRIRSHWPACTTNWPHPLKCSDMTVCASNAILIALHDNRESRPRNETKDISHTLR